MNEITEFLHEEKQGTVKELSTAKWQNSGQ